MGRRRAPRRPLTTAAGLDAGLQPERTSLAWSRTCLALVTVSALCLRWVPHHGLGVVALPLVMTVGALLIVFTQRRRAERRVRGITDELFTANPFPPLLLFGLLAGLGAAGLWFVVYGLPGARVTVARPVDEGERVKIGIVVGSIREGRKGEAVGAWVAENASGRDVAYELIDLKAFDVPLLTAPEHPMAAKKSYDDERVQAWSDAMDACDAYVFVTPEYNHGVPGAMKNAIDSLGQELVGKAVSLVGYGSVGGVRSIENWRLVLANFSMPITRAELNLSTFTDWDDETFTPADRRTKELGELFDALEKLAQG